MVRSASPVGWAGSESDWATAAVELRVAEGGEPLAGGPAGRERGEALLGVAVLLEVPRDEGLDGGAVVGVEVAAGDEVVGQGSRLVAGPGLEGGDELDLVDQAVLQGEQAEEQVAFGIGGHVRSSRPRSNAE